MSKKQSSAYKTGIAVGVAVIVGVVIIVSTLVRQPSAPSAPAVAQKAPAASLPNVAAAPPAPQAAPATQLAQAPTQPTPPAAAPAAPARAVLPAAKPDASLTGLSHPDDLVMARQLLMDGNESAMMTIETGKNVPLATLQAQAYQIFTFLTAAPHLFPPQTRPVVSADGSPPATAATAAVWENFDAFYDEMMAAADKAFQANQAKTLDAFNLAAMDIRNACDGCHTVYMHVVDPSGP